jgi:integrase
MALSRRGGIWWIDFYCSHGQRVRRSAAETADKNLAQELHDKLKAESWRIDKLGERMRRTWKEAVVRWLKESSHKATLETDKAHLRWLDRYLGGKHLDEISRSLIDCTVNRTLEVLRAILRKCVHEWEWLDRAPQVRMLKEPTRRVRFLTRDEADRLLAELPEHLADLASFALAAGLRRANVTGLEWTQVDLERRLAWVHPPIRRKLGKPSPCRSTRKRW